MMSAATNRRARRFREASGVTKSFRKRRRDWLDSKIQAPSCLQGEGLAIFSQVYKTGTAVKTVTVRSVAAESACEVPGHGCSLCDGVFIPYVVYNKVYRDCTHKHTPIRRSSAVSPF